MHDTARRKMDYIAAASMAEDRPLNEVSFAPPGDERRIAMQRRCVARVWQRASPSNLQRFSLSLVRLAKRDYAWSFGLATSAGVLGDARAWRLRDSDCMTNATAQLGGCGLDSGLTFVATDAHD